MFKHWQTWLSARQLYARINSPVTHIYGSNDWSKPEEREQNQQAIANAKLITIDKSGHFTALESPQEVANIILQIQ